MERIAEMREYILPKWKEKFAADQKRIRNNFIVAQEKIVSEFCDHVSKYLIPDIANIAADGEQNLISTFVIAYLQSGLLNRSYEYELGFCNSLLYADKNMVTSYWVPNFIYMYTVEEEEFIQKQLQNKFIRVKKYETEFLRYELFSQYQEVAKTYYRLLVDGLKESGVLNSIKINGEIQFLYGEHMGKLEKLI